MNHPPINTKAPVSSMIKNPRIQNIFFKEYLLLLDFEIAKLERASLEEISKACSLELTELLELTSQLLKLSENLWLSDKLLNSDLKATAEKVQIIESLEELSMITSLKRGLYIGDATDIQNLFKSMEQEPPPAAYCHNPRILGRQLSELTEDQVRSCRENLQFWLWLGGEERSASGALFLRKEGYSAFALEAPHTQR